MMNKSRMMKKLNIKNTSMVLLALTIPTVTSIVVKESLSSSDNKSPQVKANFDTTANVVGTPVQTSDTPEIQAKNVLDYYVNNIFPSAQAQNQSESPIEFEMGVNADPIMKPNSNISSWIGSLNDNNIPKSDLLDGAYIEANVYKRGTTIPVSGVETATTINMTIWTDQSKNKELYHVEFDHDFVHATNDTLSDKVMDNLKNKLTNMIQTPSLDGKPFDSQAFKDPNNYKISYIKGAQLTITNLKIKQQGRELTIQQVPTSSPDPFYSPDPFDVDVEVHVKYGNSECVLNKSFRITKFDVTNQVAELEQIMKKVIKNNLLKVNGEQKLIAIVAGNEIDIKNIISLLDLHKRFTKLQYSSDGGNIWNDVEPQALVSGLPLTNNAVANGASIQEFELRLARVKDSDDYKFAFANNDRQASDSIILEQPGSSIVNNSDLTKKYEETSKNRNNPAAIVGGTVGGIAGVVALGAGGKLVYDNKLKLLKLLKLKK